MKAIVFLLLVFTPGLLFGQKESIRGVYGSLYKLDDQKFHSAKKGKRKYLFWNDKVIDSTGIVISSLTSNGKTILFHERSPSKHSFYFIDSVGRLKKMFQPENNTFFLTGGRLFGADMVFRNNGDGVSRKGYGRNILEYDYETGTASMFCKLDSLFGAKNPSELINMTQLNSRKYIASICDLTIECLDCRYFLISADGKEFSQLDFVSLNNSDTYQMLLVDQDSESVLLEISGGTKMENGHFIYSQEFKPITKCLEGYRHVVGKNFKNGEPVSTNIRSNLDDGTEIIITYQYSLSLERSLYRIHAGEALLEEDLTPCSAHDLDLIRNMVFAKYNYKFKSDFYQAYFNSYMFYWKLQFSGIEKERKPRLNNVDSLLTEADRNNLVTIKQFADKKK